MAGDLTPREFADRVEWEGGVIDALEYGLRAVQLDDSNPGLKIAWQSLENLWRDFEPLVTAMELTIQKIGPEE